MNTDPTDYLKNADVYTVLDLIAVEFKTDPTSVQCFDLRLVARAIELAAARPDHCFALTNSQRMALCDILLAHLLRDDTPMVYVDVVRNVQTTPEQLLALFTKGSSQ